MHDVMSSDNSKQKNAPPLFSRTRGKQCWGLMWLCIAISSSLVAHAQTSAAPAKAAKAATSSPGKAALVAKEDAPAGKRPAPTRAAPPKSEDTQKPEILRTVPPTKPETGAAPAAKGTAPAVRQKAGAPTGPDQSMFALRLSGFLLVGYRFTLNDPKLLRLGESDGFYVSRARFKVAAKIWHFDAVLSIDGAFDRRADPLDVSPATRQLFAELRDAYIQYSHGSGFFASVGQTKVPFSMHSERSTADEHFIMFPLIAVGEDIAFGRGVSGIIPGRDIGLSLGFKRDFGIVGLKFEAMVYNGNGANTFGNDSDLPAVAGRLSIGIGSFLRIGGSVLWNQRRVGLDPNLFDESEIAFGADLAFNIAGFFLEGEFAASNKSYPTTGQQTAFGFGFRADAGYRIRSIGLEFAVRFEMYDPTDLFDDDQLIYITPAITWYYHIWNTHHIAIRLNYTFKLEQTAAQTLNNDQLNLLFQYKF